MRFKKPSLSRGFKSKYQVISKLDPVPFNSLMKAKAYKNALKNSLIDYDPKIKKTTYDGEYEVGQEIL